MEPWASHMRAIAADTGAFCKLSGLAAEAGPGWNAGSLAPFVDVLLEAFGPAPADVGQRLAGAARGRGLYRWAGTANELLAGRTGPEREAIFGANAAAFYGLAC